MTSIERKLFEQLKEAISRQLRLSHPGIAEDTKSWKKREIELFQNELLDKVQGRISEKWFYTHLKADHTSLPRIDMLDLLAKYAGHDSWTVFKTRFSDKPVIKKQGLIVGALLSVTLLIIIIFTLFKPARVEFCFQDVYSQQDIPASQLQVTLKRKEPIINVMN